VFSFTPFETYYTGNPVNPRFVNPEEFSDSDRQFSQELRLVSRPTAGGKLDYVVGAFYENQNRHSDFDSSAPGTDTYSIAEGCTAPYYFGASFPNCLVTLGPTNSTYFDEKAIQHFTDRSLYGELTGHLTSFAQITFGARHYWQDFAATQYYISYPFDSLDLGTPTDTSNSGTLYKVNPSFEYAKDQMVYATWSQGFRRGGANSYILTGPLAESPTLHAYRPDTTNNYEVGMKGRLGNTLTYSFAVFDIEWKNPQINGLTPYTGTSIVYNANKARSTGVEAELNGPLVIDGLTYHASYSYANARLTEDFSLPANNGTGVIVPGLIAGQAGERLPGSPKSSAAATLNYDRALAARYSMVFSANITYTGSVLNSLPSVNNPQTPLPGYTLGNLSLAIKHRPYEVMGYVTNVADKRAVLGLNEFATPPTVGTLADYDVVTRPREVGVRVRYTF
jgi:outer membrane receptor protein involved in Fe transport